MSVLKKLKVDTQIVIKKSIDSVLRMTPYTKRILEHRTNFVPPGHYYSPIPDEALVDKIAANPLQKKRELPAIDMNEKEQLALLEHFKEYYKEIPFTTEPSEEYRYYYDNIMFSYSDAIFLFGMLRHFQPKKVIEVGSGFSSAVILDTNQHFLNNQIECTFIEPYTERLMELIRDEDEGNLKVNIVQDFVQNVPVSEFQKLEENDICFIDSSHVAKLQSDVCYLIFEVLPALKKGVIVHIHDVFNQFEYPIGWFKRGSAWNEAYLLRAFLQYNDAFKIIAFNSYLEDFHEDWFKEHMPLCLELHEKVENVYGEVEKLLPNRGQSIWLKKVK